MGEEQAKEQPHMRLELPGLKFRWTEGIPNPSFGAEEPAHLLHALWCLGGRGGVAAQSTTASLTGAFQEMEGRGLRAMQLASARTLTVRSVRAWVSKPLPHRSGEVQPLGKAGGQRLLDRKTANSSFESSEARLKAFAGSAAAHAAHLGCMCGTCFAATHLGACAAKETGPEMLGFLGRSGSAS